MQSKKKENFEKEEKRPLNTIKEVVSKLETITIQNLTQNYDNEFAQNRIYNLINLREKIFNFSNANSEVFDEDNMINLYEGYEEFLMKKNDPIAYQVNQEISKHYLKKPKPIN